MTRPDVGMMAAALLPPGVRVVWVVAMAGLLAVFIQRALAASDERRLWYGAYSLIAAGMGVMFALNPMVGPGPSPVAVAVLVVAGLAAFGLAGWMVAHRDDGGFTLPWVLTLVDLVILAYIQVPSPSRPVIVCSAMAAYLAVQVITRAIAAFRARRGAAQEENRSRGLVGAAVGPMPEPVATRSRSARGTARTPGRNAPAPARGATLAPAAMALLTLGMFYMISI